PSFAFSRKLLGELGPVALLPLAAVAGAGRDLAGFHELLEAVEIAPGLDARFALEQLGDDLAHRSARRIVGDDGADDRAARTGAPEFDPATVVDVAAGLGLPADL